VEAHEAAGPQLETPAATLLQTENYAYLGLYKTWEETKQRTTILRQRQSRRLTETAAEKAR
jgi:hypothetical protein